MPAAFDSPHLQVLHVLTLNGRNGEYGGPVRVARELCAELNNRGHSTHIFSGALEGSEPTPQLGLSESYVPVKPLSRKLAVSSLWSWKLISPLKSEIRKADIVHIHFARDLVPFLAAFLSVIYRKPFVTQSHGMIILDGRLSTRFTDLLLTRPLINKSKTNLALTKIELSAISRIGIKSPSVILPNGISVNINNVVKKKSGRRIVFCSRLEKRKGVAKFIQLADVFRATGLKFEIYGPDGGELQLVRTEIKSRNLEGILEYNGAVPADQVQHVLAEADLLVLPSKDEPFPMVILESLAVGTPVLVMPSCGFAETLKSYDRNFVAATEDDLGLESTFRNLVKSNFQSQSPQEIINFCGSNFGIESVGYQLLMTYREAISYAN